MDTPHAAPLLNIRACTKCDSTRSTASTRSARSAMHKCHGRRQSPQSRTVVGLARPRKARLGVPMHATGYRGWAYTCGPDHRGSPHVRPKHGIRSRTPQSMYGHVRKPRLSARLRLSHHHSLCDPSLHVLSLEVPSLTMCEYRLALGCVPPLSLPHVSSQAATSIDAIDAAGRQASRSSAPW